LRLAHIAGPARLIVGISANAVADEPQVRTFVDKLKQNSLQVGYLDFLGGRSQVQQMESYAPEYLLLAANATTDLGTNPRQARQLTSIVEACLDIGCLPIVTGVRNRDDEDACIKLGVRLVASERLARPHSTSSPAAHAKGVSTPAACLA
jgi:EAL domain-containing protein (putative c-di-GMP-specific phosphodiesterase class I)